MLHLRVISPPRRTTEVLRALSDTTGVTNLIVLSGAARVPAGDLILFDVAREAANGAIFCLKLHGIDAEGSIAIEHVDLSLSEVAERAERESPGEGDDAVVWDELAVRVGDDSKMTWAFLAFLVIATQLTAIGVVIPSIILIVGAMVLGPEFGAVTAICFGLMAWQWRLILVAARSLIVGFAIAIVVTTCCALVARGLGWLDLTTLTGHPEVEFIVKPDKWSIIVAVLAGAAGVLSITSGKPSALVGVFISVTTVPAAGYLAVALTLGRWGDVGGSAAQLGINIAGMVISGTVTLAVQRLLWSRLGTPVHDLRRTFNSSLRPTTAGRFPR
ncbi:MAG TPA: DUF389 domain-containing protein [Thermopolyspora sp.]